MKSYLVPLILFICITQGCTQNNSKKDEIKSAKASIASVDSKLISSESKNKPQLDNLSDFSLLIPIKILNPNSQNIYEKYGIDFNGHCYVCDLALMRINKKNFDIVNVCDKNDFYRNEDWVYEVKPNELRIKTKKNQFIFSKIEGALVYELKIFGDKLLLKKKKISKFYTHEKELNKFKQHDCGEFDG